MDAPPPTSPVPDAGPQPSAPTEAGRRIGGRYRLERRIAGGGMASVWEAVDEVLARPVAVKLLHPHLAADEQFVARFRREAVAAARLAHPAIVSIFDTCSDGTTEAIVMELVRGTTLRAELDRRGRFTPKEAATVVAEIADALVAAHAAGIVHRDVKPANVLLSVDGRVLVADFGIAKAADQLDLTGAGTTLGTAKYLAPEQVEGRPVDGRADVYAAGVILFELLVGAAPFAADTEAATALARLHRDAPALRTLRPDVPPSLEAIAARALARSPEDRIGSAAALRDALRAFAGGSLAAPTGAETETPGGDATAVVVDATRAAPAAPAAPVPATAPPGAGAIAAPAPRTAAGGPPAAAPVAAPSPAQPSRRARRWGLALTAILVVGATGIALVLALQASGGDGGDGGPFDRPDDAAVVAEIAPFDPQGDGAENDEDAGAAIDADPASAWRSECYSTAAFGNLKDGVGLVLDLGADTELRRLDLAADPAGWSADVYATNTPAGEVAGWGERIGATSGAGAEASIELDGRGRFLLVFFTALGSEANPDCRAGNPFAVSVSDVAIEPG